MLLPFHAVAVEYKEGNIYIASKKDVISQSVIDTMFKPYGELLKEVYTKYLGKSVNEVIINNPGLGRQILQCLKNLLRGNRLVQYIFSSTSRVILDTIRNNYKKAGNDGLPAVDFVS